MKPPIILWTLLALVLAPPAQTRAQNPAGPPANPQDEPWGSPKSGLQCQLLPAAPFKVGEKFRFQLSLRNVAGEAVNLGDTKKAFVWFMVSIGGGSDKKPVYTEKAFAMANLKTNWLEGGKTLALESVEINELKAETSQLRTHLSSISTPSDGAASYERELSHRWLSELRKTASFLESFLDKRLQPPPQAIWAKLVDMMAEHHQRLRQLIDDQQSKR